MNANNDPNRRATARDVNLADHPIPPDIYLLLQRTPEPDLGEILRNLSEDGWFRLVIGVMTTLETPAELEEFHNELLPILREQDAPDWYIGLWLKTYRGMWHYFTGGHP